MQNVIEEKCRNCGRRIGWIELIVSFALACFKLFIGVIARSHALIGAAFYSIQDMISAGIIIFSTRYSNKHIDDDHPYGYGKIEFIASVCLSVGIIGGALVLFVFAGKSIFSAGLQHGPRMIAFWAATIVFVTNELLYRYSNCAGVTLNSPAILSNAAHTRADSISAACVAIGILISKFGFAYIDPIIAIFEVVHIIFVAVVILNKGYKGLMDAALPDKEIKLIDTIVRGTGDIKDIAYIRTRELGQNSQVDMEINLNPDLTFAEAELIIKSIGRKLREIMPKLSVINISIAPYGTGILNEKEKIAKIRRVLSEYYHRFIGTHTLEIIDSKIKLALNILPEVTFKTGHKVCDQIQKKIQKEIPDNKIFVEMTPAKNKGGYN